MAGLVDIIPDKKDDEKDIRVHVDGLVRRPKTHVVEPKTEEPVVRMVPQRQQQVVQRPAPQVIVKRQVVVQQVPVQDIESKKPFEAYRFKKHPRKVVEIHDVKNYNTNLSSRV